VSVAGVEVVEVEEEEEEEEPPLAGTGSRAFARDSRTAAVGVEGEDRGAKPGEDSNTHATPEALRASTT